MPEDTSHHPEPEQPKDMSPQPPLELPKLYQPIHGRPTGLVPKKRLNKNLFIIAGSVISAVVLLLTAAFIWYTVQLSASGNNKNQYVLVKIVPGTTPSQIGALLQSQSVIRSNVAFDIYTRLANKRNDLQAGTYRLSPSESTLSLIHI